MKTNGVCVSVAPPTIPKATLFVHGRQPETCTIRNVYICFQSLNLSMNRSCIESNTVGSFVYLCFDS